MLRSVIYGNGYNHAVADRVDGPTSSGSQCLDRTYLSNMVRTPIYVVPRTIRVKNMRIGW